MAIAIVTTFYGVLLANLFFFPLAGRLAALSEQERAYKMILVEGLVGISKGYPEYVLLERMLLFVPVINRKKVEQYVSTQVGG